MTLINLPDLLRRKLTESNNDTGPHRTLAPQYAYGRHRGPAPRNSHRAAVVVGLVPAAGNNWTIPLTLRPMHMSDHGGQVSLPGGRAESTETVWRTACREFGEELGCTTEFLQPIGELTPLYVYASRHRVSAMVGSFSIRPNFRPNQHEVAELIQFPVQELIAEDAMIVGTLKRGDLSFDAPGFRIGGHFVWGATAMILGNFRAIVRNALDEQNDQPWFL